MSPVERTPEYYAVIASKRWRDLRARLLKQRSEKCERCGKIWAPGYKTSLQLHHTTYERLGAERDADVQLLCGWCHERADVQRAAESKARAQGTLDDARFDGWARRKYGEHYQSEYSHEARQEMEQEFDQWLNRINGDNPNY